MSNEAFQFKTSEGISDLPEPKKKKKKKDNNVIRETEYHL